jgi:hypothetical protein
LKAHFVTLPLQGKPPELRTLEDLATIHRCDKGTRWLSRHGYTHEYDRLFGAIRHEPLHLLEIGLKHPGFVGVQEHRMPSLAMWFEFFPNATIYGVDIVDYTQHAGGRVKIFQADQGNVEDLQKVITATPLLDVVIDDGSHASFHQWTSLVQLLPRVRPGGLYIIEDINWQPPELERSLPATKRIRDSLADEAVLATLGLERSDVTFACKHKLAIIRVPVRGANVMAG